MVQYDEETDRLPQQESSKDSANLSIYNSDQTLVEESQNEMKSPSLQINQMVNDYNEKTNQNLYDLER